MDLKSKQLDSLITITITGAESSGKSTLAKQLATHYDVPLIEEYSRPFLNQLNRAYEQEDLLLIAKCQLELEKKVASRSPKMIICDTSLLVIKIWSLYKYGACDPWVLDQLASRNNDLYILPHYDIPYEEDPLREHPNDRDVLFRKYKTELETGDSPYVIVEGSTSDRLEMAVDKVDKMFDFRDKTEF